MYRSDNPHRLVVLPVAGFAVGHASVAVLVVRAVRAGPDTPSRVETR